MTTKRRDSINTLTGIGLLTILGKSYAHRPQPFLRLPSCTLTPVETDGPYFIDTSLLRNDIAEEKIGVPLTVTLYVVQAETCEPISGALVEIWHVDIDSAYSGFKSQGVRGDIDTTGQTFLRGGQLTGGDGKTEFHTVFPGWYPGRAAHIHFKVHFANRTYVASQLYFEESISSEVYAQPPYATRGKNPTEHASDLIFTGTQNSERLVTATETGNGGYISSLTIGITALSTDVSRKETPHAHYQLDQNFPNPVGNSTNIRFSLPVASDISIVLFDLIGNRIGIIHSGMFTAGKHAIGWNGYLNGSRLPKGNYYFQLIASNINGTFTQVRHMTIL